MHPELGLHSTCSCPLRKGRVRRAAYLPHFMRPPLHLLKAVWRWMVRRYRPSPIPYAEVVNGPTWACVDLGAFPRPVRRLPGLEGVVIMEDRDPWFFLFFRRY